MTDPVADLLTRIRNAQTARHATCVVPKSKLKVSLAKILMAEGYLSDVTAHDEGPQGSISIDLKYLPDGRPAIRKIERVSRPGRRVYVGKDEIPRVLSGMGVAVLSTSMGIMAGSKARTLGVGGEVLCTIY